MTRLKTEDILKPGAVLEVKAIDWNDPIVKEIVAEHKKAMRELKKIHTWRYDQFGFRRIR